jgi:hypothetical protein
MELRKDLDDEDVAATKVTWLALVDRFRFRATKR